MITELFYIFAFILTTIANDDCIHHRKFQGKSNVIVDCVHNQTKFDPKIHTIRWIRDFTEKIVNKYPYQQFSNGSLLIKDLNERSTHYFCFVSDMINNKTVYRCGTAVSIIFPMFLKNTPINETVENNTVYEIKCHAGGGDYSDLKLMFFIDDKQIFHNNPFTIVKDTKIECRITSQNNVLSSIAYIKVKREGTLTDEENFLQTQCGYVTRGPCANVISRRSTRISNTYLKSQQSVDDLLGQLFSILDNNITPEYYEDKCVDRFKRLVCSTFYPHCINNSNKDFGKRPICRESCESILYLICRKGMADIDKYVLQLAQKFTYPFTSAGELIPNYVNQFISNLTRSAKSMLSCDELPKHINSTSDNRCVLIDLDDKSEYRLNEKAESKCFNEIGRNYVGQMTNTEANIRCVNWTQVPEIYVSFYQQNLQNQSNFCRNPGGIFKTPMCAISQKKLQTHLRIKDISMVPCSNIGNCKFMLNPFDISRGTYHHYLAIALVILIVVIAIIVIVFISKCYQRKKRFLKKHETHENIPLNDDDINIYTNKVYKNTQTGGMSCPIYNAAHFEKVQSLGNGEYGEIVLVQAVIDNLNSIYIDEIVNPNVEKSSKSFKRQRLAKSNSGSDTRSVDDLILSVDKTFNEKPCWPFDKSSPSGFCPFAVIKYSSGLENEQKDSRFNKETKILSQLNHPNILRFYGICLHISNKISCRIVEYLPNGDIKSILTGRRRQPPKMTNHENNSKTKNGYQFVNALKKNRMFKNDEMLKSDDESKLFKRKMNSFTQNSEMERPQPAECIELNIEQLLKWGIEICDAIVYMHTRHYIHRDIATRNCLVGINLEAKLADFSFVQKFSYGFDLIGHPNEFIPIRWLPKETLEDIVYNTYTDVWMFGVFLWELMSLGKDPYHEYDLNEVYDAIVSDVKLQIPPKCPEVIYNQMELCFLPARQRPCIELIKNNLRKILSNL